MKKNFTVGNFRRSGPLCAAWLVVLMGLLLLSFSHASAQFQIKGKVSTNTEPALAGVSVMVKGTSVGTTTNSDGEYVLSVAEAPEILVFSFIGFAKQEVAVNGRTVIDVELVTDLAELSEVVIVGYGTQKKVNVTGAVSAVEAKGLQNRAVTNLSTALAGQVPGLTILQRGGNPGRNAGRLNIRGIGTLGYTDPLIIVDGVETGSLTEINVNDIESVSVLKDAAASAIYGVRAANGVLLITTRRGGNRPLQVTYGAQVGKATFTRLPEKVNAFELATLYNEAQRNDGVTERFSAEDLRKFQDGSSPHTHANTDLVDLIYSEPGVWQQHTLSLSGGSDGGAYNIALGYVDEGGIIANTGQKRYTFRANLDKKITPRLNAGLNIAASLKDIVEPAVGINWISHIAFREWANDIPRFPDGRYANPAWSTMTHNALSYVSSDMGKATTKDTRLIATAFAEWEILDDLKIKGVASEIADFNRNTTWLKGVDLYRINTTTGVIEATPSSHSYPVTSSSIGKGFFTGSDLNLQLFLNYEKTINNHYVKGTLGYEQRKIDSESASLSRGILSDPSLDQISAANAAFDDTDGNTINYRLRSAFARVNYAFKERYLLEAVVRRDGTSRFPKNSRFGNFPSFSVGWRIANEPFFNASFVSDLKLRASWGKLGNQEIGNYAFLSTYQFASTYFFNGQRTVGITENSPLANPNITWETSTMQNIGIDAGFFVNKLTLTAEYFRKDTDNILRSLPKPSILGAATPVENAAKVRNNGVEIALNYRNQVNAFKYNVGVNFSHVRNEIIDLAGTDAPFQLQVGDPIQSLYGYEAVGLFASNEAVDAAPAQTALGAKPKAGDIQYRDIGGKDQRGKYTNIPDGKIDDADRKYLGTTFPAFNYGINLGASYGNFDLSMLWQGVSGVKTMLGGRLAQPFWLSGASPFKPQLDRWTPENTDARFPRSSFNTNYNYNASTWWIEDVSYLKLRNVQIGYTLPKTVLDKLKINQARFYVGGENMLVITGFDYGFDPEALTSGDPLFFGKGTDTYPNTRTYMAGLTLTF